MRAVSNFIIGDTAVQIVDTGRRIRVIDVKKRHEKKQFLKVAVATLIAASLSLTTSISVVNYQNTQTLLDKKIYSLKTEIDQLERENLSLARKNEENELPYDVIYKKATALGMEFPTNSRVKTYTFRKGSAIRFHQAPELSRVD